MQNILIIVGLTHLIGLFLNKSPKLYLNLLNTLLVAGFSSYHAVQVFLYGGKFTDLIEWSFWFHPLGLRIDIVSAFFVMIINFGMVMSAIFAIGYLEAYFYRKTKAEISLHALAFNALHLAMIGAVSTFDAFSFLFFWEILSLASFLLVIFDSEKPATLRTGVQYLVVMHVGFMLLATAFMIVYQAEGKSGFDVLPLYFFHHKNLWVFLLFFVGFGIKTGIVPFHFWLPHADPAAPSHVAGIMSGVLVKLGFYGIIRVIEALHQDLETIGIIVISVGLVTGFYGIMKAVIQKDLKKMLAFSSIENMGIIWIALGTGILGMALETYKMVISISFLGAMWHILNHSLYKPLLFYVEGSVYRQTHTHNLNQLGGLVKSMPLTTFIFLMGSLAICGIPPLNGLISEYLIYNVLFRGLAINYMPVLLFILLALIILASMGGMSIFAFTRALGIGFLGTPRTPKAAQKTEVPFIMLLPKLIMVGVMLLLGIYPSILYVPLVKVTSEILKEDMADISITLYNIQNVGWLGGAFVVIFAVLYFLRYLQQKTVSVHEGETWGCGYSAATPRLQYTATTFSENLAEIVKPFLGQRVKYRNIEEEDIFPSTPRIFQIRDVDVPEETLYNRFLNVLGKFFSRFTIIQTGIIQHYLLYGLIFLLLVFLLTFSGMI